MKQPQITRLQFIHGTIERDNKLNVGQICDEFKISKAMASVDIREYRALCPGNMEYDVRNKYYFKSVLFKPMPDLEAKESTLHANITVRAEDKRLARDAGKTHAEVYRAGILAMGLGG